jgi:hypothetical protein
MAKKVAKETGTPLIVALVFFVLTTIAFGVMWYMEYAERENNAAKVADANKKATAANGAAKDAELLAKLYKVFLGVTEGDDQATLLAEQKAGDKLSAETTRVSAALAKKLTGVEDAAKLPAEFQVLTLDEKGKVELGKAAGVVDAVAGAAKARDDAIAAATAERNLYNAEVSKSQQAAKEMEKVREAFVKLTDALPKDNEAKLKAEFQKLADRMNLFTKNEAKSREELEAETEQRKVAERERNNVAEKLKGVQRELTERVTEAARKRDAFQFDEPQGKVTARNLSDNTVTVSIGSNDRVQPGLTFTVLPYDFPKLGRQSRIRRDRVQDERGVFKDVERFQPKATVEVIQVNGPNESLCRITSEYSPLRDGVIAGDLLYNSVWRKGAADHVALVGIFDRNGDGSDDVAAVVRDLERMGVRVDAFYDLKARKWAGQVTNQTRYVVRGAFPVPTTGDPNLEEKSRLNKMMSEAVDNAARQGATVVEYREFFPRMGYKIALDLSPDKLSAATAPYLSRSGELPPAPGPGN